MARLIAVPPAPTFARGFTLTELAVVLVIVALLIGGMMLPLTGQRDLMQVTDARRQLEEVREALLGFLVINSRLPCPDDAADGLDGQEDGTPGNCTNAEGYLPYATLGLPRGDPYNWLIRYRVAVAFTTGFSLTTPGDITIQTRGDDPSTPGATESKTAITLAGGVAVAFWSVGKNGNGGVGVDGYPGPPIVASTDEALNNSGAIKITRFISASAAPCSDTAEGSAFCQFDDIVAWIPTTILMGRMNSACRAP